MNESNVHLARGEAELGEVTLSDARELLTAGFLLPTDVFWMPGQSDWLPMSQLPAVETSGGSAFSRFKDTLAGAALRVQQSAEGVTARAAAVVGMGREQVTATTQRMLEDYVPALKQSAQQALAQSAGTVEAVLADEAMLRKIFGAMYDVLPTPVYRFVSEAAFVEFCFRHRQRLLKPPGKESS